MQTELRRSPRVPFIAAAEVIDVDTEVRLSARTGDLSSHGCYVDMVNPLPLGSAVRIEIAHADRKFGATAGIIYSQTPLGMGLEFREVDPGQRVTLEEWLSDPERLTA